MARSLMLTALLAALLAAVALGGCTPSRRAAPPDGTATVVSVTDGDTIDVDIAGHQESVRLLGIDTPNPDELHPTHRFITTADNMSPKPMYGAGGIPKPLAEANGERESMFNSDRCLGVRQEDEARGQRPRE